MTSKQSQPAITPAQNTTAATSAPSYASAAGATKKPASTPLVVTGANPSSGAGSSVDVSASAAPVNGQSSVHRPGPTVANGTSSLNGEPSDHSRSDSLSITAPRSDFKNPAPGSIKFGYDKTPQPSSAVPIPNADRATIPSPAISPAPIPQPSASGGKPGTTENHFQIGSFPNDGGDRMAAMRGGASMPFINDHTRRGSNVSHSSGDMGHHGGPPGRGGFAPRGRGGGFPPAATFVPGTPGGYPGPNYNRGQYGNQGRGAMMAQQPYPRGPIPAYPNSSPRISHGSPGMAHAAPGQGTPNMAPAMAVPSQHGPVSQYSAPMSGYGGYQQQGYHAAYQQGYDNRGYMGMPNYPQTQMYAGSPGPAFYPPGQQYTPPPHGAQAQQMSRGNSHQDRPASSTGGPMMSSGLPPPPNKESSIVEPNFYKRPQSKKISIKGVDGKEVNLLEVVTKPPPSPVPVAQQSKTTPPIIATTPTPLPNTSTPESEVHKVQVQADFLSRVADKAKLGGQEEEESDDKEVDAKTAADEKPDDDQRKQQEDSAQAEQKAADVKAAEVKAVEIKAAEAKAAETKAAEEADKKVKVDVDVKAKAEADAKVEEPEVGADGRLPGETEDEYWDRLDKEMAEKDAIEEAKQAAITAKKNAEKEAAKKAAEKEASIGLSAEENDRKLREQEREMERIEEAREKARELAAAKSGNSNTVTVAALLAGKISEISGSKKKETPDVADKLSKLTINSSLQAPSTGSAPSSAKSIGKDRRPAALNLVPLKTGSVEAPPPSAAMQALKSSRFLTIKDEIKYPQGIQSPNPASNPTAAKKGGSFKYDSTFLLQFQKVFTEQPSTEFSQQVKALIGESDGSRSASTRGSRLEPRSSSKNAGGIGSFGAFTQAAGGKTLPPNTTSDQRFAMSQGQMSRPAANGPMASFGRGAFPGGAQMGRAPSGMGGLGSRQGSTRAAAQPRGNSSRQSKGYDAQSKKFDSTMPLTAGLDLKPIQVSSTGWKPMSLDRNAQQPTPGTDLLDPATVQRKVKSNLNKMTPENFDKISGQILQIAAQSKDESDGRTLRQVIQLTFEKATDEAHWAAMYAKFCQCMLENMSPEVKDVTITDKAGNVVSGGALFRKYLLNRCQEDFERGWNTDMPAPKDGESKEAALMSDEYYKAMAIKRRGLGLIQFIGELFRLGMLTERIMHECVRKLLDFSGEPDEAEIESLTKLLRTIGADLDNTEKGSAMMNAYFQRIQTLVDSPGLPSRLHFMLMDIIDLRKVKWVSKDGLKGPKTRDEIRADAEAALAAKAAEASRSNNNNRGYQGQGQGRYNNSGRQDSRNSFQPNNLVSNNVAMDDLRRLKGSATRAASGNVGSLGPSSMFNSSRSNSNRKMGPGGSLARGADDSGNSSRTGTPAPAASSNTFAALAGMTTNEDGPASPPSTAASPALNHAKPDKSAN